MFYDEISRAAQLGEIAVRREKLEKQLQEEESARSRALIWVNNRISYIKSEIKKEAEKGCTKFVIPTSCMDRKVENEVLSELNRLLPGFSITVCLTSIKIYWRR